MTNPTQIESIQQQLVEYLRQHADVMGDDFGAETDLLEQGVLDSLLVTDLVVFTRKQFEVELTARDITPENLSTLGRLARLIAARQSKMDRAA